MLSTLKWPSELQFLERCLWDCQKWLERVVYGWFIQNFSLMACFLCFSRLFELPYNIFIRNLFPLFHFAFGFVFIIKISLMQHQTRLRHLKFLSPKSKYVMNCLSEIFVNDNGNVLISNFLPNFKPSFWPNIKLKIRKNLWNKKVMISKENWLLKIWAF